jgi:hypothetical protein
LFRISTHALVRVGWLVCLFGPSALRSDGFRRFLRYYGLC